MFCNCRYGSLLGSRRRFVESLCQYDDAMVLLPAFSYVVNTALSFRALYTIYDFEMPIRSAFMNPNYLRSLAVFWRSHGLLEKRHSTGLMMVSLALELCDNVDLFGFWPFGLHPESFQELTHHYYDNNEAKKSVHVMSDEFKFLLQLHNQGVLNLHLGECVPEEPLWCKCLENICYSIQNINWFLVTPCACCFINHGVISVFTLEHDFLHTRRLKIISDLKNVRKVRATAANEMQNNQSRTKEVYETIKACKQTLYYVTYCLL